MRNRPKVEAQNGQPSHEGHPAQRHDVPELAVAYAAADSASAVFATSSDACQVCV